VPGLNSDSSGFNLGKIFAEAGYPCPFAWLTGAALSWVWVPDRLDMSVNFPVQTDVIQPFYDLGGWLSGDSGSFVDVGACTEQQSNWIFSYLAGYWNAVLNSSFSVLSNPGAALQLLKDAWNSEIEDATLELPMAVNGDISPEGIHAVFEILGQLVKDQEQDQSLFLKFQSLVQEYQSLLRKACWLGTGVCATWGLWAFVFGGLKKPSSSTIVYKME
jgi:hypothetical protein